MGDPGLALIFAWHGALRGAFISVSRVIFPSVGRIFCFGAGGEGGGGGGVGHFTDIS